MRPPEASSLLLVLIRAWLDCLKGRQSRQVQQPGRATLSLTGSNGTTLEYYRTFPCGCGIVPSRFFSVSLKDLSQGKSRRRSLQGPLAYPGVFSWGVQQIQLRTDDRENGDLGAVAP